MNVFIAVCFLSGSWIFGQNGEVERLISNELKMTFPSIYFKNNSVEYIDNLPYTLDSCYKFIAGNCDRTNNSLVIWRDSAESEELTRRRIKKVKAALKQYGILGRIEVYSMGAEQKISRNTINLASGQTQRDYLISLNSVFEISKSMKLSPKKKAKRHLVWTGWRHGFHWSTP